MTYEVHDANKFQPRSFREDLGYFATREAAQAVADDETKASRELGIFNRYIVLRTVEEV